ncbi:MAG: histidinol-phosphatase HisJ family protein [Turicibacter sp.]|nr:histidinol-phosphatase HisJ family protein [Turicibacter sp.]
MIFDTHIHTTASPDGTSTPEEIVEFAKKQNLGCIFTEHADYNHQHEPMFCVDFESYPEDYIRYRDETTLLGLEINLSSECLELNAKNAADERLDFVIGSVHCIDDFDIGANSERTRAKFEEHGEEFYARYFEYVLKNVKESDFFDSFGHIDYISRYSSLPERNVLYEKFHHLYDSILNALIERNKVLELNSSRLQEAGAVENLTKIYSRYTELGGKYVTLGSDAHTATAVGRNFDIAMRMVEAIGLEPVYFKGRRMVKC